MQIEDYMHQKDLYPPLGRKTHKPKEMSDDKWGDSRSESPRGDLIVPDIDGCLQHLHGKDNQRLDDGAIEDVQETIGVKQGVLDEKVIQPKDADSESIVRHLNELNMLTSQLESVEINFEDDQSIGFVVQSAGGLVSLVMVLS